MNMKQEVTIPMSVLAKDMTVDLKVNLSGLRWWMFRMRLALALIRLSALICPVPVDIEDTAR